MQQIWDSLLQLMARFVTPDWGALIGLIPIGLLALIVLVVALLVGRMLSLGPRRQGKGRVAPRPPEGVHMPGPSLAPIFAAIGTALLMFGLVFGGPFIPLGLLALVLTLLYWGREAMHDYDRVAPVGAALPAVVQAGPPPGVHMPGPSFRPLVAAIALAVLMYGLVFGGWLLAIGLVMLVISLVGWLRDARVEYRLVEEADATGHLENAPDPRVPTGTLTLFGALLVLGIVLNSGLISSQPASGATGGSPAPSGPTGPTGSAPSVPVADLTIHAAGIQYAEAELVGPAGRAFAIAFVNQDAGVPHNVEIYDGSGKQVFSGDTINGVNTTVYNVPALTAGTYKFACKWHPNMVGTLTVK
jgi:plastocyanin